MDGDVDYGFTRRPSDYWPTGEIASLPQHLRPDKGETLDLILRQKIYLVQSRRGYRVNTDSHVLAYFASKVYSQRKRSPLRVLDLGAGVGLASILFAKAHTPTALHLLDLQGQLVHRAQRNLQLNKLQGEAMRHDLKSGAIPGTLRGRFDVILMNPPFYKLGERRPPWLRERLLAHMETSATFSDFLCAASSALDDTNPDAFIAIIHDRKEFPRLEPAFGANKLSVLQSRQMIHAPGALATRILFALQRDRRFHAVEDEKNRRDPQQSTSFEGTPCIPCLPPLTLHSSMGDRSTYSDEIEEFLSCLPNPPLQIGRLKEKTNI